MDALCRRALVLRPTRVGPEDEALVEPSGECINAREFMNRHPMRNPLGWELKSYALLHSSFREMLLLDADNVAVQNPDSS